MTNNQNAIMHPTFSFLPRYLSACFLLGIVALLALSVPAPSLAHGIDGEAIHMHTAGAGSKSKPKKKEAKKKEDDQEIYDHLQDFGKALDIIRDGYVEEVETRQLITAAINGMLRSLDPHSGYLSDQGYEDMQIRTKGKFGGLGIHVTMEEGVVKVVSPIDETPAARAGIQPGDLIVEIDGEPVFGMTLQEAVNLMRGEPGTPIELKILRGKDKPIDVSIVRDHIKIISVRGRIEESNVGYLRITDFNRSTHESLVKAVGKLNEEVKKENPETPLVGYILDLRNNPGGLLDQAIFVSDAFLTGGEIVSTRGRHQRKFGRWDASKDDIISGLPMVVLINGGSASASEIVAGALQDHKRAILLGTRSFGKGSVQTIRNLTEKTAIRMTTARYYTPSGRSIQSTGIEPDILVEQATIQPLNPRNAAREENLPKALDRQKDNEKDTNAEASKATPQDYQLQRAIDLLQGLNLLQKADSDTPLNQTAKTP